MIDILVLRLEAPLLAFGGAVVDKYGVTRRFPGRAMLTGLLGNALGYRHGDSDRLNRLQDRLHYAVRCDRAGELLHDYQTVDLGQPFLAGGWTTSGKPEGRGGDSKNKTGTHIRLRQYLADAVYTVAITLSPTDDSPRLAELERTLRAPARPLFIGRKCCLPSGTILLGRTAAENLIGALEKWPCSSRVDAGDLRAWWPANEGQDRPGARLIPVTDDRDWLNQIHVGRRWIHEGVIHG